MPHEPGHEIGPPDETRIREIVREELARLDSTLDALIRKGQAIVSREERRRSLGLSYRHPGPPDERDPENITDDDDAQRGTRGRDV
jgi:hypothetical protein